MSVFGRLFGWKPRAPKRLHIKEIRYFLDGGTTMILGWGPWWGRWSITLTQHVFEDNDFFGMAPGRLYLGSRQVPMRGELERDIIALIRRCLAELRQQPQAFRPPAAAPIERAEQGGRAIIFVSPDLAELHEMSPEQQDIRHLEQFLAYVESDDYGKITQ